jgi:hypothetical protein
MLCRASEESIGDDPCLTQQRVACRATSLVHRGRICKEMDAQIRLRTDAVEGKTESEDSRKMLLTALPVAPSCVLRVYELPGGSPYIAREVSPAVGKTPCKHLLSQRAKS